MAAFSDPREGRGWLVTLWVLTLLPLVLTLFGAQSFALALARVGAPFAIFLALDALLILALLVALLDGTGGRFERWTRWRGRPGGVVAAALASLAFSAFAMYMFEISGLAANTLLIRVSVWLGLVVWLACLLRLATFSSAGGAGRWVRFGVIQLIFLVFVEIAISLVFPQGYSVTRVWFRPGPSVAWRDYVGWAGPINGAALYFSPGEFTTLLQTNEYGYRDHPVPYERQPGVFRILALGDSYTWAQEVMLEDTWHVRLEEFLSTPDQPVEVVAVGYVGWGTDQQLQYFIHEGCRYQPDLVLLQMFHNDVENNYQPFEFPAVGGEVQKPYYELDADGTLVLRNSPFGYPEVRSELPFVVKNTAEVISRTALIFFELLKGSPAPLDFHTRVHGDDPEIIMPLFTHNGESPEHERAYALTGALLQELGREVEACDARLAAFLIPHIHPPEYLYTMPPWYREAFPDWADIPWHYREPERRLTALAVDAGIPILPYERIVAVYDAYYAEHGNLDGVTWRWISHLTPYGNEQVAAIVADWLRSERLVPATSSP